eukprot:729131-Prorocentrum_minimum.AAC.1
MCVQHLVSDAHSLVSDSHSLVSDSHSLVSDSHSLVSDSPYLASEVRRTCTPSCTPHLYTFVHSLAARAFSYLYTFAHMCTHLHTFVHICTHLHTFVHICTHCYELTFARSRGSGVAAPLAPLPRRLVERLQGLASRAIEIRATDGSDGAELIVRRKVAYSFPDSEPTGAKEVGLCLFACLYFKHKSSGSLPSRLSVRDTTFEHKKTPD